MNDNSFYLFATVISFATQFFLFIPFINFLYYRKMQRMDQKTTDPFGVRTPIFDRHHAHKVGTPVGGGILVIVVTVILFAVGILVNLWFARELTSNYPALSAEIFTLLFAMISFGLLGLYDDLSKIFYWQKSQFFGMRMRQKLVIEMILATVISSVLFFVLKIDLVHIPFLGTFHLSYFYILFAAFVIVAFSNAVNITDGLDGLSCGVLMISLIGFWIVARSIIDVPTSLFISVWLGGILAFLYFNVYPARIMLGDTGSLAFGAVFAVIGLILGKPFALLLFGGIFVIEAFTSGVQLLSKRFLGRRIFTVSPFHLYLQNKGWQEPKVVFRMWIIAVICALLGLAASFLR